MPFNKEGKTPATLNVRPTMTQEEVQEYLGIGKTIAYELRKRKLLKIIYYGGSARFLRDEVHALALKGWKT